MNKFTYPHETIINVNSLSRLHRGYGYPEVNFAIWLFVCDVCRRAFYYYFKVVAFVFDIKCVGISICPFITPIPLSCFSVLKGPLAVVIPSVFDGRSDSLTFLLCSITFRDVR